MVDNPSPGTKQNRDQKKIYWSLFESKNQIWSQNKIDSKFSNCGVGLKMQLGLSLVSNLDCGYSGLYIWSLIESNFQFGLKS